MSEFKPKKFIVLTDTRCGATYTAHCLSNHPDIFCVRHEPFHNQSMMRVYLGRNEVAKMRCTYSLGFGYKWAGFRLQYDYISHEDLEKEHVAVIHLIRRNVLRSTISRMINHAGLVPTHTTKKVYATPIEVKPAEVIKECRERLQRQQDEAAWLDGSRLKHMTLYYSEFANSVYRDGFSHMPYDVIEKIAGFLEVGKYPLYSRLVKVNDKPLKNMVLNWKDIAHLPELAEWIDGEE